MKSRLLMGKQKSSPNAKRGFQSIRDGYGTVLENSLVRIAWVQIIVYFPAGEFLTVRFLCFGGFVSSPMSEFLLNRLKF